MFGTVIIDAYSLDEVLEVADALDDLCSPKDNYGWASAGIYCFWDYYAEEILYIGLASDLADRFKQHNGLKKVDSSSCKYDNIQKYFESNDRLGYSIFVQSALAQPLTHRNKKQYSAIASEVDSPVEDMMSKEGKDDIKRVEGILIEAFKSKKGIFPPWNKVGGSVEGQKRVMENNYNIVRSFCNPGEYKRNPILSRSTLRELSQNPSFEGIENYLHGVRMQMLIHGMEYEDAYEFTKQFDTVGRCQQIVDIGYDKKVLVV